MDKTVDKRKENTPHKATCEKEKKQDEKLALWLQAQEKKDSNFVTIVHTGFPQPGSAEYFFHQENGTLRSEWTRQLDERPSGRRPNHWRY